VALSRAIGPGDALPALPLGRAALPGDPRILLLVLLIYGRMWPKLVRCGISIAPSKPLKTQLLT
jgi:hypothetical protein